MATLLKTLKVSICLLLFISCTEEVLQPGSIFNKVYDDVNSDKSYYPLDIVELDDGGFYVLSQIRDLTIDTGSGSGAFLSGMVMRLDEKGVVMWSDTLMKDIVSPLGSIIKMNNKYVFFTYNKLVGSTKIISISDAEQSLVLEESVENSDYPLAVSQLPDGGALLLTHNKDGNKSNLVKYSKDGTVVWIYPYRIMEDKKDLFYGHTTRTGSRFPFFVGSSRDGKTYFANMLENYTLSLIVANSNRTQTNRGYHYESGYSAYELIDDTTYFAMRYSQNDRFIMPFHNIGDGNNVIIRELDGVLLPEIEQSLSDKILRYTFKEKDWVVCASSTNNNQVFLYFYDVVTKEFMGRKEIGFGQSVKLSALQQTKKGDLILLMETELHGQLKRVAVQKLSKEKFVF